jgi:hypothetical protein
LAHLSSFQSAIYQEELSRNEALEVLWYEKDVARFTSSAGKPVPGSTDRQRKQFKRQLELAAEHNTAFDHPKQSINHRPEFTSNNSFDRKSEWQQCI